ncbi:MAG: hypothetical protein RR902_00745 [Oscillospiraceae bacterium]
MTYQEEMIARSKRQQLFDEFQNVIRKVRRERQAEIAYIIEEK